ncbi:MAG: hypothetical protein KAI66_04175, partial [Lentisphaeria bacterium]|nr:hypothetical protein [Lentisphaeria bacterium]
PSERQQWLPNIARHRLSIRHLASPKLTFENDTAIADFTAFDAELAWATSLGMNLFQLPWAYVALGHGKKYTQRFGPIGEEAISDEFRRKFPNAMRVLGKHLDEKGILDRFNHNLFDEPNPKHYAQLREMAALLRQGHPRYRPSVYGVGRAAADGELAGVIEEPIGAAWDPEVRDILRRRGGILTVYNPVQVLNVTRRPELARGFGWWAWRCDLDRVYHWCIGPSGRSMHGHDYGSAWVFGNPGHDAFFSTVRFEMLREGLEDYDYLTLFRQAFDEVAAKLKLTDIDSRECLDFFAAQLSEYQIVKQCIEPEKYLRMHNFLGTAIETFPKQPLALFRLSPGKEPDSVRIQLWTEPGAKARVGADLRTVVSGMESFETTPGPDGAIDLVVTRNNRAKRLRIPVR